MSKAADQEYLLSKQYRDASNLNARVRLHKLFSVNPYGWNRWLFDQFDLPPESRVLEVGCGPGGLWIRNSDRIPEGWRVTLSDFSGGMLKEAVRNLSAIQRNFRLAILDAQCIPFADATFDAVVANHMLYHVPDIPAALKEINRVLKPGCCLYAATNGSDHLQEIKDWKLHFFPDQEDTVWGTPTLRFSMKNGEEQLRKEFGDISFLEYPDTLLVDQVEPIIRYIRSYTKLEETDPRTKQLRHFLQNLISENGSIQITKESGLFRAAKY